MYPTYVSKCPTGFPPISVEASAGFRLLLFLIAVSFSLWKRPSFEFLTAPLELICFSYLHF
ncbi:hypothetical protein B4129_0275 [Bacillus safensis]|nr:hypothetical protein B4129_0275 [Bacillus safensis]